MTIENTLWVVDWPHLQGWTVEGGSGSMAALGVISVHPTKDQAIREAQKLGEELGATVTVVDNPKNATGDATAG